MLPRMALLTITILAISTASWAGLVYPEGNDSIFPETIQKFVNKQVSEKCYADHLIIGAYNEEIEQKDNGTYYKADLMLSFEDHGYLLYFTVFEDKDGKLEMPFIECPPAHPEE